MTRYLLSILSATGVMIVSGCMSDISAKRIDADEAFRRATSLSAPMRKHSKGKQDLVHTETRNNENLYYIFSGDGNFSILPADDSLIPVIGYSDSGAYDPDNINPALQYWLDFYGDEIEWFYNNGPRFADSSDSGFKPIDHNKEKIPTLPTAKWNQSDPYNLHCPVYNGRHAVTGCVATSMAIIAKYFNYPEHGYGSRSYNYNGVDIAFDFDNTSFDWENMLDVYDDDATDVQKDAVATLMLGCGVAVTMQYTPQISGAYSELVARGMIKYLGYSPLARHESRQFYTLREWEILVYEQLKNTGPLNYGGSGKAGGHQFVCDGYDGDGFFHINWGWGGDSDGFFRLSALNPNSLGIGGGGGGFNYNQSIISNLRPPREGDLIPMPHIVSDGYFRYATTADSELWMFSGLGLYSLSADPSDVHLGLRLTDENGNHIYFASEDATSFPSIPLSLNFTGLSSYSCPIPLEKLEAGKYRITPAFLYDNRWENIPLTTSCRSYVELKIDDNGKATYTNLREPMSFDMLVTDFKAEGEVDPGVRCNFSISVTNYSAERYSGYIYARLYDEEGVERDMMDVELVLSPEKELSFRFKSSLNADPGMYRVLFTDCNSQVISNYFPLLVGKRLESASLQEEHNVKTGERIPAILSYLPEDAAWPRFDWVSDDNEIAMVDDDGYITGISEGETLIRIFSKDGSDLSSETKIIVTSEESAVEDIHASSGKNIYSIYTSTGILIARNVQYPSSAELEPGIYIISDGVNTKKICGSKK